MTPAQWIRSRRRRGIEQAAAPGQFLAADDGQLEGRDVLRQQSDRAGQQTQALSGFAPGGKDDQRRLASGRLASSGGEKAGGIDTAADHGVVAGKIAGDHAAGVVGGADAAVQAGKESFDHGPHELIAQKALARGVEGGDSRAVRQPQGGEGEAGRVGLVNMQDVEALAFEQTSFSCSVTSSGKVRFARDSL